MNNYMPTNFITYKKQIHFQNTQPAKLNQEDIENLNRPIKNKWIESVTKNHPGCRRREKKINHFFNEINKETNKQTPNRKLPDQMAHWIILPNNSRRINTSPPHTFPKY